jgi:hypothetical protein
MWLVPGTKFKSTMCYLAYIRCLKRLLLDRYKKQHRADLVKLRQKAGEVKKRFKGQLLRQKMGRQEVQYKALLRLAQKDSDEKKAEIEALKSELQKSRSSSLVDITMIIKEEHAGDKDKEAEIEQLMLTS